MSRSDYADMDRDANIFAAFLLMPSDLFAPYMADGINLDDDRFLERIAKRFRVPMGAVVYRMMLWGQTGS